MNNSFLFRLFLPCLFFALFGEIGKGFAQNPEANRANIWYFGNGAGLDFSSGSPVAITNGALHTYEGCASMCDLNGNLLMYTDGDTIWDRNHNPMPNGTGLMGCYSSSQSCIIIPKPMSNNLFYVFTVDCGENNGSLGLRYSIIDMNLNSGYGDITTKNILLYAPATEGLTATKVCDTTVWLASHEINSNKFYTFKITPSGINTTPIISSIGSSYNDYVVYMRFSPNGKMLASCFTFGDELYLFDSNTGIVSNNITLLGQITTGYSPAFSSDNTKLYITNNGDKVIQYDVSIYNSSTIINSQVVVSDSIPTWDNSSFWAISNAPDYKMYIAGYEMDSISSISYPNLNGISCYFQKRNVSLSLKHSQLGLPDFIQSYFNTSPEIDCSEEELFIPNVFSPNGDGINDLFRIEGLQEEDEVSIYNRWGTKVYELANINDGWDGRTTAGEKCSTGVYFYYIKRKKNENKKGFIHLFY